MKIPPPPNNRLPAAGGSQRKLHCTTGDHDFYVIHGVTWYSTPPQAEVKENSTTWRAEREPGEARALRTTITCAACATAAEPLDEITPARTTGDPPS